MDDNIINGYIVKEFRGKGSFGSVYSWCPFAKPHGIVHSFIALRLRLLMGGHSTRCANFIARTNTC
jgi:hypothetical protein